MGNREAPHIAEDGEVKVYGVRFRPPPHLCSSFEPFSGTGVYSKLTNQPLPLESVFHVLDIRNLFAGTLTSTFQFANHREKNPVELIYKLWIPPDGSAPHDITVRLTEPESGQEHILSARVMEKSAAQDRYDDVIAESSIAVLMERENDRDDVVSLSLGHVLPGWKVCVQLVKAVILSQRDVFDREEEGGTHVMSLASRRSVLLGQIVSGRDVDSRNGTNSDSDARVRVENVSIAVNVSNLPLPVRGIRCQTGELSSSDGTLEMEIARGEDDEQQSWSAETKKPISLRGVFEVEVGLVTPGPGADTDTSSPDQQVASQIDYFWICEKMTRTEDEDEQQQQEEGQGATDEQDRFAHVLSLFPFRCDEKQDTFVETEFIWIVDRSGSMRGDRITCAKKALILFLRSLDPEMVIRFDIISFGSKWTSWCPEGRLFDEESCTEAMKHVETMGADMGGTDIHSPLREALHRYKPSNRTRCIFLATDGEDGHSDAIIDCVRQNAENPDPNERIRVYTFGIGKGIDTAMLRTVAETSNAAGEFVSDAEEIKPAVMRQLSKALVGIEAQIAAEVTFSSPMEDGRTGMVSQTHQITPFGNRIRTTRTFLSTTEVLSASLRVEWPTKTTGEESDLPGEAELIQKELCASVLPKERDAVTILAVQNKISRLESSKNADQVKHLGLKYKLLTSQTSFILEHEVEAAADDGEMVVEEISNTQYRPKIPQWEVRQREEEEKKRSESDIAFNVKFTAKSFEREARRAEKQIRLEKRKAKSALERGEMDGARIFAENAIRKKNESLNYYKLSARMDAVASRVETAVKMKQVTRPMKGIVRSLNPVLKTMDVDKISREIDKFERQYDDLDVRTTYMDDSMASSTAFSSPETQVNALLGQIADEYSLSVSGEIGSTIGGARSQADEGAADDLSSRLAALRSGSADSSPVIADATDDLSSRLAALSADSLAPVAAPPPRRMDAEIGVASSSVTISDSEVQEIVTSEPGRTSSEVTVSRARLEEILLMASLSGVWECNEEIARLLGISLQAIKDGWDGIESKIDLWMTAVVVVIIEVKFARFADEWGLIVKKSKRSLQRGLDFAEVLAKAKDFVDAN